MPTLQTFSFAALTVAHGRTTAPRIPLLRAMQRRDGRKDFYVEQSVTVCRTMRAIGSLGIRPAGFCRVRGFGGDGAARRPEVKRLSILRCGNLRF